MSPDGPPGQQAEPRFPQQLLPTAQSVLWRPTVQELARPESDASPVFLAQRALAAVEDHLRTASDQPLFGFLAGRVFETPDTRLLFVVAHGALRMPQTIPEGATEHVVGQSLAAAQRMLSPEDGVVVGWYRTDPTGVLKISPGDHEAHVRHFHGPWQFALLMAIRPFPVGTRGGVFRPVGDVGSPVPYLSFYELLDSENDRAGWKRPLVAWSNYWSPDPAVWRMRPRPEPQVPSGPPVPAVPPVPGRRSGPKRVSPVVLPPVQDDYDVAWHGPRGRFRERWWILVGAAVGAAIALGIRLGLGPQPAGLVGRGDTVAPSASAPAVAAPPSPEPRTASPEPRTPSPLLQALDAYRLRARRFADQQTTCTDLAQGLSDVDDQWLRYTMTTAQASVPADTGLAAAVDSAEADFERSGCPRP
jgi:hypothetical protein